MTEPRMLQKPCVHLSKVKLIAVKINEPESNRYLSSYSALDKKTNYPRSCRAADLNQKPCTNQGTGLFRKIIYAIAYAIFTLTALGPFLPSSMSNVTASS